ncbi:MAG: GTP-binding protein [Promethearchaeota archaeon]
MVYQFKVVLIGDGTVGKTTLVKSFMGGEISDSYKPTLGADIGKNEIKVDDEKVILQLWDLSGQSAFEKVRSTFYLGAVGAIAVYDVMVDSSYNNILQWLEEMYAITGKVPVCLVGNKIDLREQSSEGAKTEEDGKLLAKKISEISNHPTPFIEASALKNVNSHPPFIDLTRILIKLHPNLVVD